MPEFEIQTGVVKAVRFKTESGRRVPFVDVQSHKGFDIVTDLRIDTPLFAQHIPRVDQVVTIMRTDNFGTRIIAVHGERPFDAPIEPGESVVGGSGGSFAYFNNSGDVMISDAILSNVIKMLSKIGILIVGDTLSINIKGVGMLNITPKNDELGTEDKIELLKLQGGQSPEDAVSKVTMTKDKIVVDNATVELGLESDPIQGGVVVSQSQIPGAHSFDILTGWPIPSSAQVKAKFNVTPGSVV